MPNNDTLMKKVRKLLTMARREATSDEMKREAETALRHAQALMRKHGIALTEVDVSDDADNPTVSVSQDDIETNRAWVASKISRWDSRLASAIAKAFACGVYRSRGAQETLCFFGLPTDIAAAKEALPLMRKSLSRAVRRFLAEQREHSPWITAAGVEARSFKDGFCSGLWDAVCDELARADAQAAEPVQIAQRGSGTALMVLDKQVVAAKTNAITEWSRRRLRGSRRSRARSRDYSAFEAGRAVGRAAGAPKRGALR